MFATACQDCSVSSSPSVLSYSSQSTLTILFGNDLPHFPDVCVRTVVLATGTEVCPAKACS